MVEIIKNAAGHFVKYKNTEGNLLLVNVKSIDSIEYEEYRDGQEIRMTIMLTIDSKGVQIVENDYEDVTKLYRFFYS